jgi:hypothetical protein
MEYKYFCDCTCALRNKLKVTQEGKKKKCDDWVWGHPDDRTNKFCKASEWIDFEKILYKKAVLI